MPSHETPGYEPGTWLAYPVSGGRAGEGGDCYEVVAFGDNELDCLRYCTRRDGFKPAYLLPGQSLLQAVQAMDDLDDR